MLGKLLNRVKKFIPLNVFDFMRETFFKLKEINKKYDFWHSSCLDIYFSTEFKLKFHVFLAAWLDNRKLCFLRSLKMGTLFTYLGTFLQLQWKTSFYHHHAAHDILHHWLSILFTFRPSYVEKLYIKSFSTRIFRFGDFCVVFSIVKHVTSNFLKWLFFKNK